ncbi:hypothetical protein SHIRM173S_13157 [Streptomyces hirsutus]
MQRERHSPVADKTGGSYGTDKNAGIAWTEDDTLMGGGRSPGRRLHPSRQGFSMVMKGSHWKYPFNCRWRSRIWKEKWYTTLPVLLTVVRQ